MEVSQVEAVLGKYETRCNAAGLVTGRLAQNAIENDPAGDRARVLAGYREIQRPTGSAWRGGAVSSRFQASRVASLARSQLKPAVPRVRS